MTHGSHKVRGGENTHTWGGRGKHTQGRGEETHGATDAEWPGAELSKTLATELLKSRQRSGQRGYVDVEVEGQPTQEPLVDTRPDVNQILEAVVPTPSVFAPIPEEGEAMDTTMPEVAFSGFEIRPRQPDDCDVRPRLATDQEVIQLEEVENQLIDHVNASRPRPDTRRSSLENLSGVASSTPPAIR